MNSLDDQDLEARLRRISAGPELGVPASVYRHLKEVANGDGTRSIDGVQLSPVRLGRGRSRARLAGALAALAAALAIAVSAAGLLVVLRGPQAATTWTIRADAGHGEWTGLEWHDITALAGGLARQNSYSPGSTTGTGGVVQWRGGFAAVGGDFNLWLSTDGLTWKPAAGAPRFPGIVAIDGDLLVSGQDSGGSGPWLWRTADGVTWTRVSVPFDVSSSWGLTAGGPGVVAAANIYDSGAPPGLSGIYFTTDAQTWTQATLPSDLAAASNVYVSSFIGGFVALALVSDPNGSTVYDEGTSTERRYSERAWISRDGLIWSTYDPVVPSNEVQGALPWTGMQVGRLGAGDGRIYSTDHGVTWLADKDNIPSWLYGDRTVSDGSRIVMSAGSGSRFYLSEGDGHWRLLQQGGDAGSLPADGQMMLLPNGVLWIAGNRVYFGQGLSGVAPEGSLGPPTTASPGASVVQAVPTTTPVAETTPTPGPTPTAEPSKSP
jgi:hypothetical protein